MLDMARKAISKVQGRTRDAFDVDENLRMTLAHLIQVIGEAARHVSPECQRVHPDVPWAAIIGMRHKVVHDYLHVDYDLVWDVVTVDLPPLVEALERFTPSA